METQKQKNGIMIAAVKSGSGKTLVTCGLLAALKKRGLALQAFKAGPDYIDPMFHRTVLGIPSGNLDTYFADPATLERLFDREGELMVVEGVMGLYDGLGGTQEAGSSYDLAATLQLPIVLILDARGMGRTMLPVLAGMLQYDREHLIRGVILNRTTPDFCKSITPLLEQELGIPVLGCLPQQKEIHLESRHLGLKRPEEISDLQEQVERVAASLEEYVDIRRLLQIAGLGRENGQIAQKSGREPQAKTNRLTIAVARDRAFCFLYEENLRLLQEMGARLVFFSPLQDKKLPEKIQGLLLPGGYPELLAKELSDNRSMRLSVKQALERGLPCIAECGGFLYLHDTLEDETGVSYPMCGVIHGASRNTGHLVRFGYVELREKTPCFMKAGTGIRGHEFHYYDSTENGAGCYARKPVGNRSWEAVHVNENQWLGFPHLYFPSNPDFVRHFLQAAEQYGKAVKKEEEKTLEEAQKVRTKN